MRIENTLEERGEMYGEFRTHSVISQTLKESIWCDDKGLSAYQKEALEMIAHKIARILNGDPNYIDSWRDISGYAELVIQELEQTEGATDCEVVYTTIGDEE